jgi:CRP-like cAMP-binding protein
MSREIGPGDVFGEDALVSNEPCTSSVKAVTDVVVMCVSGEVLSNALGLNRWMGSFVGALAERLRELKEQLTVHERRTRPTRPPPPNR